MFNERGKEGLLKHSRILLRIFDKLGPAELLELEFIKIGGQRFFPVEINPVEKRFFGVGNFVRAVSCFLFDETPVEGPFYGAEGNLRRRRLNGSDLFQRNAGECNRALG